jgi:hypothetical protein
VVTRIWDAGGGGKNLPASPGGSRSFLHSSPDGAFLVGIDSGAITGRAVTV